MWLSLHPLHHLFWITWRSEVSWRLLLGIVFVALFLFLVFPRFFQAYFRTLPGRLDIFLRTHKITSIHPDRPIAICRSSTSDHESLCFTFISTVTTQLLLYILELGHFTTAVPQTPANFITNLLCCQVGKALHWWPQEGHRGKNQL